MQRIPGRLSACLQLEGKSAQYLGPVHLQKGYQKSMKTAMKARVMKKKAVSKIARGKLAKVVVFKGNKETRWWFQIFKHFLFSPLFGEDSYFD